MPSLLRLPFWLAEGLFWDVLTAHLSDRDRAAFALSNPEWAFARHLLRHHRQIWIYRAHQQRACGDFVLIDMSCPHPARRLALVLELKSHGPMRWEGGGLQVRQSPVILKESLPPSVWSGAFTTLLASPQSLSGDWLRGPLM